MQNTDRALTIKEVADFLNISKQMVYNLINGRKLEAFKVGSALRILYSDLLMYIAKQKHLFTDEPEEERALDESLFMVRDLCYRKGDFCLDRVSFSFPRAKTLAVLGPSGAGKTLLLRCLAGLEEESQGLFYMGRERFDQLGGPKREVGFVFEDLTLLPFLTAGENIKLPHKWNARGKSAAPELFREVARELQIPAEHLSKYSNQLPEGIKQIIVIAREKMRPLKLFLLDDPLGRLDPEAHRVVHRVIQKLIAQFKTTTILSLSSPRDALALSDYVAVLDEGRLIQFGETQAVYAQPRTPLVMQLFAPFGVNRLEVEVRDNRILPWDIPAEFPAGPALFMFRSEEVQLSEQGISVRVHKERFYDSRLKFVEGLVDGQIPVTLLVPVEAGEELRFLPSLWQLFSAPGAGEAGDLSPALQ